MEKEVIEELGGNISVISLKYESQADNSGPWSSMYNFLVKISKKLDWPVKELLDGSEQEQLNALFSLKDKIKQQQMIDVEFQAKLNKQISFFCICVFFNKLNEFNCVVKEIFSNKLILGLSLNKSKTCLDTNFKIRFLNDRLTFILNLWFQLEVNAEYHNIVSKCLNNCKLENLFSLKQFITNYYSIYKHSLLNDQAFVENVFVNYRTSKCLKSKMQYIAVILLEKDLVKVR